MLTVMKSSGEEVNVVIVKSKDAHNVKKKLEELHLLDKDFRLASAVAILSDGLLEDDEPCKALPLQGDEENNRDNHITIRSILLQLNIPFQFANQICPYSSAFLGNRNRVSRSCQIIQQGKKKTLSLTLVQSGIIKAFVNVLESQGGPLRDVHQNILITIEEKLRELNIVTCPKTLQYIGDDRTIVIPLKSFDIDRDKEFSNFISLGLSLTSVNSDECPVAIFLSTFFWKSLADAFNCRRVVRRGEISPNSQVRFSEYKILWPPTDINTLVDGIGSPGWISITENGIKQSFDMTKVMFSRGNITEKMRFGKLVQPGEIVLDMYAGIGYFTLPALVHGGAEHVYCCEWNEQAVKFLQYNLADNNVSHRATVHIGDCRELAKIYKLVDMFDRVSLGLLPSSEGGWRTGIKALRRKTGGWLHIHGNVPYSEVDLWALWLSERLRSFIEEEKDLPFPCGTTVLVYHVEKVKSFAPTVNHYVADVFIGSMERIRHDLKIDIDIQSNPNIYQAAVYRRSRQIVWSDSLIQAPSCAISEDGPINQEWMKE